MLASEREVTINFSLFSPNLRRFYLMLTKPTNTQKALISINFITKYMLNGIYSSQANRNGIQAEVNIKYKSTQIEGVGFVYLLLAIINNISCWVIVSNVYMHRVS